MYPQSRHLSAKVRIFVDWISELIQRDPIFQSGRPPADFAV
jgi:hypothetical protein